MHPGEPQVYLNGQFVPRSGATLDIEDRGALFGDGVYEVVKYHAGRPFAIDQHLGRLRASLAAIRLPPPADADRLGAISDQLMTRNGLTDADVYWQITRGSAPRNHVFCPTATPTVCAITYPRPPLEPRSQAAAISAILSPDQRWHRCDIKSLMLLPNVLAKNHAIACGADEAIFHRDGRVTEGSATSVFVVHGGQLWTHPADQWILDGITRRTILELAGAAGVVATERRFTTQQLMAADEVMVCGTTRLVAAVVAVDGRPIARGAIGPVTTRLHDLLMQRIVDVCGPSGAGDQKA